MTSEHGRIKDLMERMKSMNSVDAQRGAQEIFPPTSLDQGITTMKASFRRALSPMLQVRFAYASKWVNARLSQDWLGLDDIAKAAENDKLMKAIQLQADNCYGNEPPAGVAPENCAIFAYNPYEFETTWLVWVEGAEEPRVWEYFGADSSVFLNLEHYLEYIVGDRRLDDKEDLSS